VGYFPKAVYNFDLVDRVDGWGEPWNLLSALDAQDSFEGVAQGIMQGVSTSMHTEDLIVDDDAQREKVEHIRKVMPHIRISILPRAFRIESI